MANSKNITFDQLQAALSRVKSALDGKANTSHGNHVPKTETANNARFLRNDNTWQTVTPVNIGAADRSHTHGEYINQNTFTNVKIGDTTIEADSPTDTLTLNAGANVTITPDAINDTVTIEAKDTIYTHPTNPGNRHIPSGGSSGQILRWSEDGTAAWGSENNTFTNGSVGGFTVTPENLVGNNVGMTSSSGHGYAFWAGANGAENSESAPFKVGHEGRLYATNAVLAGTLDGNATTATRLQAAHKFTIGNAQKNFDGSADITWTLSEIGAAPADHIHTSINHLGNVYAQSTGERASKDGLSMQLVYNNGYPYPYGNVLNLKGTGDGQLFIGWPGSTGAHAPVYVRSKRDTGDAWSDWAQFYTTANPQSDITGNAGTATKLAVAKTITIGNTGKSFDGSGNVSWSLDEIGAVSPSHTHDRLIENNNNITLSQANDHCGLDAVNNVNVATWYGFSISNNCSNTDNYGQVTFSVDARSGQVWTRGNINAPSFSGSLYGNANTATTLANSRKFTIGNAEKYFNGSSDVSWTLDEMGVTSAIAQSGNSILNTVSNTYTTKDEFNNLKIGGRNYVKNSNFDKGLSYWTTTHSVSDTILHNGHKSLRISVNGTEDYTWSGANQIVLLDVEPNTTVTISCWYYIQDKSTFDSNFGFELKGKIEGIVDQVFIGVGVAPNEMENGVWKRLVATATTDRHWDALYAFPWVAKNGTIYVTDFKIELGNKATDWTPALEDMNDGITAINNKFADYSTTNQMNSAIQVAENDAKMDIRHNYVTKHEAAHYFEGENKWKLDLYSLGSMSASATPTKELMIQNNCQYQGSYLVEHPNNTSAYADNYVGYATTYMHFTEDYQWNGRVVTDDNGNVYLNDVLVLSTPTCQWTNITLNFKAGWNKLEVLYAEGGGGDGWQFDSEIVVVPGGVMNKMNCYGPNSTEEYIKANYSTTQQMNSAINQKANEITSSVSSMYSTKAETNNQIDNLQGQINNTNNNISNNYASKSELQQTTNSITAKFSESGGYNLLRNSGFKNGLGYWNTQTYNSPQNGVIEVWASDNTWGFPDPDIRTCVITLSNQDNIEYGITQTIYTTIGKTYTVSFYYASHRMSQASMIIRRPDSTWLTNKAFNPSEKSGGNADVNNWGVFTHTFTATHNIHTLNIVVNSAQDDGYMWIANPMICEGELPCPYSPHPSEVYDGITQIDKDGIKVYHNNIDGDNYTHMSPNGFYLRNKGEDVFRVNADGLYLKGKVEITSGSVPSSLLNGQVSDNLIGEWIRNGATNGSNAITRLNSSAGAWDNAYNRVAEWAYGSVGGSTTINGGKIQSNTITSQQLSISDFSNYSQLRVGHNLSSKYGTATYVNNDVDNHCYWCNGDNEYFPFTVNETVNPFKYGDKVGFKFDAYVQNALDVRIGVWFYSSNDCNDYMTERTADIHLNPGWNSYSTQITIDCTEVRRARSVAILIHKGENNYIEVRNAVISRMISNAMIEDRAVTANKLGTIGGFQVEDRLLRGRNGTEGNNYVGMSGDGFGWAFWAGAYNGGDAPFHVGHEGHLYATNATLAGTLDGNATTASRLQSARTLTIGNTGKNFDGSGNVSWSLAEIGAAASGHTHDSISNSVSGNSYITTSGNDVYSLDTPNNIDISSWFGVSITNNCANTENYRQTTVAINARTGEATLRGGITAHGAYMTNNIVFSEAGTSNSNSPGLTWNGSTDGADLYYRTLEADQGQLLINLRDDSNATLAIAWNGEVKATFDANGYYSGSCHEASAANKLNSRGVVQCETGTDRSAVDGLSTTQVYNSGHPTPYGNVLSLRGMGDGQILVGWSGASGAHAPVYVRSKRDNGDAPWSDWAQFYTTAHPQSDISGNAGSASRLQYARTFTVGNTGKNFDGTGNISWSLDEIGAAPSSHGHNFMYVKGTNTIGSVNDDTTSNWGAQQNSVHWYAGVEGCLHDQPSSWGYLLNIGQGSEVHQLWMTQVSGNLLHRGGNGSGWSGSWKTILDSDNYSTWAAAKSHTHDYAASNHTHNYAASNHNHDSAYLKLSGGTLSGSLTVNNNVYSQGFCVSKNGKEVWFDIGDNDTYIWASGANKSLQITHGGDLNFNGQPVLYGGRGNNYDTATNTIYFNNGGTSHKGRISCYNNTDGDYVQVALRTVDATTNYLSVRTDTVNFGSPIVVQGHKLTIQESAPSNPARGDVWINIG